MFIVGDTRANTGPNGVVARVRIYNKVLTGSEVSSNYSADRTQFIPVANISLTAANGLYRVSQSLTATTTQPGTAKFYVNNKVIPGCGRLAISTSATCNWKPSVRGNMVIKVVVVPTDPAIASKTTQSLIFIGNRSSKR